MARTFDPTQRDAAVLCLFGTDYQVAEATRAIMRRMQSLQRQIEALGDDADNDTVVGLMADMVEATLVDSAGVADTIRGAWNNDEISLPALVRTVEFLGSELQGTVSAGES